MTEAEIEEECKWQLLYFEQKVLTASQKALALLLRDKLEEIARIIRNNPKPFGGIQLIVSGDFLQLPPVGQRKQNSSAATVAAEPIIRFCFESKSWTQCMHVTVHLTKVYRQTDSTLIGYAHHSFESIDLHIDDQCDGCCVMQTVARITSWCLQCGINCIDTIVCAAAHNNRQY